MLIACCWTASLQGQDYPAATYLPGMYSFINVVRLSADGRYVTMMGANSVVVADGSSDTCVLIIELHNPLQTNSSIPAGVCTVSPSGSELVYVDTTGKIQWYHVGERDPWRIDRVGRDQFVKATLVSDSVLFVDFNETSTGLLLTSGGRTYSVPGKYNYDDDRMCDASRTAEWWATVGKWSVIVQSTVAPPWTITCDTVVLDVVVQNDSILIITMPSFNQIVNVRTRNEVARMSGGKVWGFAPDGAIVVSLSGYNVRMDPHSYRVRDTIGSSWYGQRLIRSRFLVTYDSVIDLQTDSVLLSGRFGNNLSIDVLPSHVMAVYDYELGSAQDAVRFIGNGTVVSAMNVFRGPVVACAQDPRDSAIYMLTSIQNGDPEEGRYGQLYRLRKHDLQQFANPLSYSGWIGPFRKVQQEWCLPFSLSYHAGLMKFGDTISILKRFERRKRTVPFDHDGVEGYDFADDGSVLRTTRTLVTVEQCSVATAYITDRSVLSARFVPRTTYFMSDSVRYDYTTCSDSLAIARVRVSPHQPLGLAIDSLGSCALLDLREPYRPIATAIVQIVRDVSWADSGSTVRVMTPDLRLTSLSSNGAITVVQLPKFIKDGRAKQFWSHNGRVVTFVFRDTLVSIDVVTTKVLRQWIGAPYLLGLVIRYPSVVVVSDVDAHVIVSSQNGIVSVFDGVELDVTTSMPELGEEHPFRYVNYRSIVDALPYSCVNVFDLLGSLVSQFTTDGAGQIPRAVNHQPIGSYYAMYTTAHGPRVVRIWN